MHSIRSLEDYWLRKGFIIKYLIVGKDIFCDIVNYFEDREPQLSEYELNLNTQFFGRFYGYDVLVVDRPGLLEAVPDAKASGFKGTS